MEFIYNINKERNLIHVKCTGNISFDELIKNMTKVNNDPNFRHGMNTLADISKAIFDFNYDELDKLRSFTQTTERIRGKVKWAVVIKSNDTQYTVKFRMFQDINKVHGVGIQTRGFNTFKDAFEWLQSEE